MNIFQQNSAQVKHAKSLKIMCFYFVFKIQSLRGRCIMFDKTIRGGKQFSAKQIPWSHDLPSINNL